MSAASTTSTARSRSKWRFSTGRCRSLNGDASTVAMSSGGATLAWLRRTAGWLASSADVTMTDLYYEQTLSLSDFVKPRARHSDPLSSHEAGAVIAPSADVLRDTIRRVVAGRGPMTAWAIADEVARLHPNRWKESSIRSACAPKRSGLSHFTAKAFERPTDPKPRLLAFYYCAAETVDVGERL